MSESIKLTYIKAQSTSNGEPIWVFPRTKEVYTKLLTQISYDLHSKLGISSSDSLLISANALTSIGIHVNSLLKETD